MVNSLGMIKPQKIQGQHMTCALSGNHRHVGLTIIQCLHFRNEGMKQACTAHISKQNSNAYPKG